MNKRYLQVALPVPLRRHYAYVIGDPFSHIEFLPGMRVSVPFGRRKEQVGMALAVSDRTTLQPDQLKSIGNVIDYEPLFSQRHFEFLCWAADYYHYPVGEALFSALPALLRQGKALPGQDREAQTAPTENVVENRDFDLNTQQIQAIDAITANTEEHGVHLLQGVTGSGKTEVYIEAVKRVIAQNRQALILVPEIGLTTQFIDRLRQRLPVDIRVQHSALSETERLRNWQAAKNGACAGDNRHPVCDLDTAQITGAIRRRRRTRSLLQTGQRIPLFSQGHRDSTGQVGRRTGRAGFSHALSRDPEKRENQEIHATKPAGAGIRSEIAGNSRYQPPE